MCLCLSSLLMRSLVCTGCSPVRGKREHCGGKTSGWLSVTQSRDSDPDNPEITSCGELKRSDQLSCNTQRQSFLRFLALMPSLHIFCSPGASPKFIHYPIDRGIFVFVTGPKYVFWSKPPVAIWCELELKSPSPSQSQKSQPQIQREKGKT